MYRTLSLIFFAVTAATMQQSAAQNEWPVYGGDPGGSKYSTLRQINRENVSQLRVAWTFSTGDPITPLPGRDKNPAFEATPIVVDAVMYFGTPYGKVFALDPATGKMKWSYDAGIDRTGYYGDFANRGVSTWFDIKKTSGEPCRRRIFFAPVDARLIALDAASGEVCKDFGRNGQIDLTEGLDRKPLLHPQQNLWVVSGSGNAASVW
jgi:quinoprotein glucose dehydrogenase